jgi:hypothetical protein
MLSLSPLGSHCTPTHKAAIDSGREDMGFNTAAHWFGISHQKSNLKVLLKDAVWLNRTLALGVRSAQHSQMILRLP